MKIGFSSRSSRYQNDFEIRFANRTDPILGFRSQRWISRFTAIYNPDLKIWIHVSQSNVPLETWPSRRATFVISLVRPGQGSLRKQSTFHDANTVFPAKWHLRNERRNSILMKRHYPDLGRASDWLKQIFHTARPIRSTTQIWIVLRRQYGISALISQTSFRRETSGGVLKRGLFSQAR